MVWALLELGKVPSSTTEDCGIVKGLHEVQHVTPGYPIHSKVLILIKIVNCWLPHFQHQQRLEVYRGKWLDWRHTGGGGWTGGIQGEVAGLAHAPTAGQWVSLYPTGRSEGRGGERGREEIFVHGLECDAWHLYWTAHCWTRCSNVLVNMISTPHPGQVYPLVPRCAR